MANKAFTKIPNEILEALARTKFRNYEIRYILVLLRKTFGFHKRNDRIPNSQFVRATGIKKQHISRTQKDLINRKVVTLKGYKLALNWNYLEWKNSSPTGLQVTSGGSRVTSTGGLKRNYSKENNTTSKRRDMAFKKEDYNSVLRSYQSLKGIKLKGPEFRPIEQAIKNMFMADRTPEQIVACMEWLAGLKDDWAKNWTIGTVQKKMPEFVAGKFIKDNSWKYGN